mmetsp:Transcript_30242/g.54763  ORF Transcript_30242/g.54763 Transcript_30242/m.54763 type:complete len:163 (+) Transcript_30242:157-645(+)
MKGERRNKTGATRKEKEARIKKGETGRTNEKGVQDSTPRSEEGEEKEEDDEASLLVLFHPFLELDYGTTLTICRNISILHVGEKSPNGSNHTARVRLTMIFRRQTLTKKFHQTRVLVLSIILNYTIRLTKPSQGEVVMLIAYLYITQWAPPKQLTLHCVTRQ